MVRFILAMVFTSLIVFCNEVVLADEVVLENGDRLTGEVTRVEGGKLTLETEYAETIHIQMSKIKSITTTRPVEVHLISGEILKGKLQTIEEGRVEVESTVERGPAVIDRGRIKSINPPPVKWTGDIRIGANQQSGNTENLSASIGAELSRKTDKDRIGLRFLFNYSEDGEKVTARNTYGALEYNYFFVKHVYGLLSLELLSDKFRDLNLRTIVGPGVGYLIWDDNVKFLSFEAGVSYFLEDRDVGKDNQWASGRLAGRLKWQIFQPVGFSNNLFFYPRLEDFSQYTLRNEAGLNSSLSSRWSISLLNIFERDGRPAPGVEKNDIQWILALRYSF